MSNFVKVSVPLKQRDKQMTISGASQSGMGVFYQAIPDVGTDGKNVMKLIPVQRVNGQFVRTQVSCNLPNTCKNPDTETQRVFAQPIRFTPASRNNVPVTRYVLQRPSDVNFTVNPVSGTGNLQDRVTVTTGTPIQVHVPIVTTKVAPNVVTTAPPVLNCGKTITLLNKKQLPVAVKSPALPSGHYLQIPPNAEVKTLPASALPQAIKKRILTPPENSTAGVSVSTKSLPTVVYVSPVNAMKLNAPVQAASTSPGAAAARPSPNASVHPPLVPAGGSAQPPKISSKANQAPVTPFKWVVQEQTDGLAKAPFLVPQDSSMTSDILKALAQMEKSQQNIATGLSHKDNKPSVNPGKDNALVMCNGKMYFVAKKMPEFDSQGLLEKTNEGPTKHLVTDGTIHPPSQTCGPSPAFPKSKVPRLDAGSTTRSIRVDEVIDLCDDDSQEERVSQRLRGSSSVQPAPSKVGAVEEVDDDEDSNVIFVSYIPPKSSTVAGPERETTCEKLTEKEVEIGQEKEMKNCPKTKTVIENVTNEEGATNEGKEACEEPQTNPPAEKMHEGGTAPLPPARINVVFIVFLCKNVENDCQNGDGLNNPVVSERENTPESDERLKRRFGITADVKVFLQRIPSTEMKASPKKVPQIGSINKRTLDGIRKLIQNSRIEMKTKKLIETQVPPLKRERSVENHLHNVKRKKEEQHENAAVENTGRGHLLTPEGSPSDQGEPSSGVETLTEKRDKTTGESFATSEESNCAASTLGAPEPMEAVEQTANSEENVSEKSECATVSDSRSQPETGLETGVVLSSTALPAKVASPAKGKGRQCRATQTSITCNVEPESVGICDSPAVKTESSPPRAHGNRTRSGKGKAADTEPKRDAQDAVPTVTSGGDTEPASVEVCCPPTLNDSGCSIMDEPSCSDLFSATPMDPEEIRRHEKIKRLKELVKEKEAALEMIRKNIL
ncbi:ligand-dependent nuclear receptor-interacting factor 1 [Arapaima gigas]